MAPNDTTQTLPAVTGQQQVQVQQMDLLDRVSDAHAQQRDQLILMRSKLEYVQRMARMFALSGCFADIKDTREDVAIAKACVKIKLGESMGFSEAESMMGIDIIQGRPAVGASLRAARMQLAGYSWPQMILTNEGCWMPLEFKGKPLLQQKVKPDGTLAFDDNGKPVMVQTVVAFTKQDAVTAGLFAKDNYKKNPRNMFFARTVTNAQRWFAPGCLSTDILDTYEAADLADGAVVNVERREPERAPLSMEAFRPSEDEHRGHDDSMTTGGEQGGQDATKPVETTQSAGKPEVPRQEPKSEPKPEPTKGPAVPPKRVAEMSDAMDSRIGLEVYHEDRHYRVVAVDPPEGDVDRRWQDIGEAAPPVAAAKPAEEKPKGGGKDAAKKFNF